MPSLSDPIVINGVKLRNRTVLPPITINRGTPDGEVTDETIGFYRQRAERVGLVIVEAAAVRPDGRIGPLSLGLWNDGQIAGMSRLAQAIKSRGAAAIAQLNHAGAKGVPVQGGIIGASPSGVGFRADAEPTVLNPEQIGEFVSDFTAAAIRAQKAGFDGVEIHGAHLYLLSQFFSPLTNKRTDSYGGSASGRAKFAVDVVKSVRQATGPAFLVTARINAVELTDGGLGVEDAATIARLLEEAGANAIHASCLSAAQWVDVEGKRLLQNKSYLLPEQARGELIPYAARIKTSVSVPVIGIGKLSVMEAEKALREGTVDMVAFGRQMIADPKAAAKILDGRPQDVVSCKECWACAGWIAKGVAVKCSTNRDITGEPQYA